MPRIAVLKSLAVVALTFISGGCTQQTIAINFTGIWEGIGAFVPGDEWAGLALTLTMVLSQTGASLTGEVGFGNQLISFLVPIESGRAVGRSIDLTARGVVSVIGNPVSVTITLAGEYPDPLMRGAGTYTIHGMAH
ncbi:MAG TPA: hypothetical protein PKM13_03465, partial [Candidatus Bipolaricaulis anaerobius]|nr:hypothetical protein [Candidatus Bipolaricaulis anaerobius]